MNIAEAKQQIKDTVEAYLARDEAGVHRIAPSRQRPLFLLGAPGIGKTAIMAQIAQELGCGLVSYSMTHHTRQSALGLPFIVHRAHGGEEFDVSEYTMSEIVSAVYDYQEEHDVRTGILFLDEINCVSETLYPSMLQFLQFKTFGRHRVPADWVIVCAGNPPEYNKSVHEFDIVTLDRLRKIEVEPDYAAWKAYASNAGVHPAIMSFIEVKRDCFYSVESTPSGKRFVTARGWDDLSETMTLFEEMGKPVDRGLIAQFLQDDEIADRFAAYYDLFNKYRSDYQVMRILDGKATPDIVSRAQAAAFDERLALLGLLLDALGNSLGAALSREAVVLELRDMLREAKPALLAGGSLSETLGASLTAREKRLAKAETDGTRAVEKLRVERLAIEAAKRLCAQCELARALSGEEAFDVLNAEYRGEVATVEPLGRAASEQLEQAFAFVEDAFDSGREMLVFVTELTARRTTSQFINRFGSDAYYRHNNDIMVDDRRRNLVSRIGELGLEGASAPNPSPARSSAPEPPLPAGVSSAESSPAPLERVDGDALATYYREAQFEFGFSSLCKMTLPDNLLGKTVLDVGCRRGKGVFKLSARVGDTGRAIGVDWTPEHIAEATSRMERAWRDSGLARNNMEFHLAYPEDLLSCGIGDGSVDVVFVNSVVNLAFDPACAFIEIARVLRPGGLLVCETVVASAERDLGVVEEARALGNSIQAAMSRPAFERLLADAGFEAPAYGEELPVAPSLGFKHSYRAEVAPSSEDVAFTACVVHARKAR